MIAIIIGGLIGAGIGFGISAYEHGPRSGCPNTVSTCWLTWTLSPLFALMGALQGALIASALS